MISVQMHSPPMFEFIMTRSSRVKPLKTTCMTERCLSLSTVVGPLGPAEFSIDFVVKCIVSTLLRFVWTRLFRNEIVFGFLSCDGYQLFLSCDEAPPHTPPQVFQTASLKPSPIFSCVTGTYCILTIQGQCACGALKYS